eukprot:403337823
MNQLQDQQPCGDLCRFLSSDHQRHVIHAIMNEESGILVNKANQGKVGDKKYLVSSSWWRQWCDFVNFDQISNQMRSSTQSKRFSENQGQLDLTQIISQAPLYLSNIKNFNKSSGTSSQRQQISLEVNQPNIQNRFEDEQFPNESARVREANFMNELINLKKITPTSINLPESYEKPGMIINKLLLRDGRSMNLKENIIEHHDFEAVSVNVWRHLYSWYSSDWCIMRYLKRDRINGQGVYLDLYPEVYNYHTTNNDYDDMDVDQDDENSVRTLDKMILSVPAQI